MADISYYKERQEFGMGKKEARECGLIPTLKQERAHGLREPKLNPSRGKYKEQDLTKRKKQDPTKRKKQERCKKCSLTVRCCTCRPPPAAGGSSCAAGSTLSPS